MRRITVIAIIALSSIVSAGTATKIMVRDVANKMTTAQMLVNKGYDVSMNGEDCRVHLKGGSATCEEEVLYLKDKKFARQLAGE